MNASTDFSGLDCMESCKRERDNKVFISILLLCIHLSYSILTRLGFFSTMVHCNRTIDSTYRKLAKIIFFSICWLSMSYKIVCNCKQLIILKPCCKSAVDLIFIWLFKFTLLWFTVLFYWLRSITGFIWQCGFDFPKWYYICLEIYNKLSNRWTPPPPNPMWHNQVSVMNVL